jgi:voltage-gated potassium channel
MEHSRRRSRFLLLGRSALTAALVLGAYYAIPVEPGISGGQLVVRVVFTVLAAALVTWLIAHHVARQFDDPAGDSLTGLLNAIIGGVAVFALADYVTAIADPGQFADLRTKTDALYFALATLTTVGYGDVHAVGQVARVVVSIQLVFNVVVIATGASVLARMVGARARQRHGAPPPS